MASRCALMFTLLLAAACGPAVLNNGDDVGDDGKGDTVCSTPGATRSCYSGAAGTENVGPCSGGTQTCSSSGTWDPCTGEVVLLPRVKEVPAGRLGCLEPQNDRRGGGGGLDRNHWYRGRGCNNAVGGNGWNRTRQCRDRRGSISDTGRRSPPSRSSPTSRSTRSDRISRSIGRARRGGNWTRRGPSRTAGIGIALTSADVRCGNWHHGFRGT